jgi:hypothetical protein
MSPELRRQLLDEFTPEIERLGQVIGRDLSQWLERDPNQRPLERTPATTTA